MRPRVREGRKARLRIMPNGRRLQYHMLPALRIQFRDRLENV